EGAPHLLPAFPEPLRVEARVALERLGVEVRLKTVVTNVDADGIMIGPERIDAATVLWAAGVAASPLGTFLDTPLDRAGRVPVLPTLQVPNHPNIFVAGDLAALSQGGTPLPGVAQVAMQEGT